MRHAIHAGLCGLALFLSSCGGVDPIAAPERASASFRLEILDTALAGQTAGTVYRLEESSAPDGLELSLNVTHAADLRGLYYRLSYDPTRYVPAGLEPGSLLGAEQEQLSLQHDDGNGSLLIGQLMLRPQERTGFSGSGELARLKFRLSEESGARRVQQVNESPAAEPLAFRWNSSSDSATWFYINPGDYDQNGIVGISDLTPLAVHFGEAAALSGQPFAEADLRSVIDGDGNGLINLADITAIGVNFGNSALGGYSVLKLEAGSETEIARLSLAEAFGDAAVERLWFEYFPQGQVGDETSLRVRLLDPDGNLGFPSTHVATGDPVIVLKDGPAGLLGSGSSADPYILTPENIDAEFSFSIRSGGIEVTGNSGVDLIASNETGSVLGYPGNSHSVLAIDDGSASLSFNPNMYQRDVRVSARIGQASSRDLVFVYMAPEEGLHLRVASSEFIETGFGSEALPYVVNRDGIDKVHRLEVWNGDDNMTGVPGYEIFSTDTDKLVFLDPVSGQFSFKDDAALNLASFLAMQFDSEGKSIRAGHRAVNYAFAGDQTDLTIRLDPASGSGNLNGDVLEFTLADILLPVHFQIELDGTVLDDGQFEIRSSTSAALLGVDEPLNLVSFNPAFTNQEFELFGYANGFPTGNSLRVLIRP
ncbi:hypothetical protein KDL44_03250 [bacterium]|nr:hypothetical protein [bacterium]